MTIEASQSIVDAILSGDKDQFNAAFQDAMTAKVSDALEIKKVEVASNWLGATEVAAEEPIEATETEVTAEVQPEAEVTTPE